MEKKLAPIVVKDIHLLQVEVVQQQLDVKAFKKEKEHKLNVGHKLMHNLKDERVKLEYVFSFNNGGEAPLLFFQIDTYFNIDDLTNYYELTEDILPVFSTHLVTTLIGI